MQGKDNEMSSNLENASKQGLKRLEQNTQDFISGAEALENSNKRRIQTLKNEMTKIYLETPEGKPEGLDKIAKEIIELNKTLNEQVNKLKIQYSENERDILKETRDTFRTLVQNNVDNKDYKTILSEFNNNCGEHSISRHLDKVEKEIRQKKADAKIALENLIKRRNHISKTQNRTENQQILDSLAPKLYQGINELILQALQEEKRASNPEDLKQLIKEIITPSFIIENLFSGISVGISGYSLYNSLKEELEKKGKSIKDIRAILDTDLVDAILSETLIFELPEIGKDNIRKLIEKYRDEIALGLRKALVTSFPESTARYEKSREQYFKDHGNIREIPESKGMTQQEFLQITEAYSLVSQNEDFGITDPIFKAIFRALQNPSLLKSLLIAAKHSETEIRKVIEQSFGSIEAVRKLGVDERVFSDFIPIITDSLGRLGLMRKELLIAGSEYLKLSSLQDPKKVLDMSEEDFQKNINLLKSTSIDQDLKTEILTILNDIRTNKQITNKDKSNLTGLLQRAYLKIFSPVINGLMDEKNQVIDKFLEFLSVDNLQKVFQMPVVSELLEKRGINRELQKEISIYLLPILPDILSEIIKNKPTLAPKINELIKDFSKTGSIDPKSYLDILLIINSNLTDKILSSLSPEVLMIFSKIAVSLKALDQIKNERLKTIIMQSISDEKVLKLASEIAQEVLPMILNENKEAVVPVVKKLLSTTSEGSDKTSLLSDLAGLIPTLMSQENPTLDKISEFLKPSRLESISELAIVEDALKARGAEVADIKSARLALPIAHKLIAEIAKRRSILLPKTQDIFRQISKDSKSIDFNKLSKEITELVIDFDLSGFIKNNKKLIFSQLKKRGVSNTLLNMLPSVFSVIEILASTPVLREIKAEILPILLSLKDEKSKETHEEKILKIVDFFVAKLKSREFRKIYREQISPELLRNKDGLARVIEGFIEDEPELAKERSKLKIETSKIVDVLANEDVLKCTLQAYEAFRKNSMLKAMGYGVKAFFKSSDVRSLVGSAIVSGFKSLLRDTLYPNWLRKALIEDDVRNALSLLDIRIKSDSIIDLNTHFNNLGRENSGIFGYACRSKGLKGLNLEGVNFEKFKIDNFDFRQVKFGTEGKSASFGNSVISNTNFAGASFKCGVNFARATIDLETLNSLLPALEKQKNKNPQLTVNFDDLKIVIPSNMSKEAQADLKTRMGNLSKKPDLEISFVNAPNKKVIDYLIG